jgi:hypothetical protein
MEATEVPKTVVLEENVVKYEMPDKITCVRGTRWQRIRGAMSLWFKEHWRMFTLMSTLTVLVGAVAFGAWLSRQEQKPVPHLKTAPKPEAAKTKAPESGFRAGLDGAEEFIKGFLLGK